MALPITPTYSAAPGDLIKSTDLNSMNALLVATINDLPEKDGTVQANLNADLLDSFHASASGGDGTIPVCGVTLQTLLNADLLDGLHASEIAEAAFDVGTKMLFYQANPPSGWSEVVPSGNNKLFMWGGGTYGTQTENSWTISGITIVVDSHVLSTSELPSHSHGLNSHTHTIAHTHSISHTHPPGGSRTHYVVYADAGGGTDFYDTLGGGGKWEQQAASGLGANPATSGNSSTPNSGGPSVANTQLTGGNSGHSHTGTASQDGGWTPPIAHILIASKD